MRDQPSAPGVAFFDLDKTIISRYSERELASQFRRRGLISFLSYWSVVWAIVKYQLHVIRSYSKLKRVLTKCILGNKPVKDVNEAAEACVDERLFPSIYPQAIALIERYKREGWLIYLVSSSYAHVVRQFGKKLQADGVFATELEIADGMYTGEICGPVYNGKEKVLPVIKISESCRIPTELCHAYGDHFSDHFMLSFVGKAFAVNPDKRLRHLAVEKNWEVLSWTHR